jgi:hypothetical protein
MRIPIHFKRIAAYTLVELTVVAGSFAIVGGAMYVLMSSGLNLFARNHSINHSSEMARTTLDRLTSDMHVAIESPTLINSAGEPVPVGGDAPVAAAGIRFRKFIAGPLRIPSALTATNTTVTLAAQASDRMPEAGQFIIIPATTVNVLPQDVHARILAARGSVTMPVLDLTAPIGTSLLPPVLSGNVAPANSVAYIVQEVAYVVVTPPSPAPQIPELRFYPRAMSAASDTASKFNNPANYTVVTPNMVATPTPFRVTANVRAISVQFTAEAARYSNQFDTAFPKTFTVGTSTAPHTIPYKSLGL